MWNTLCDVSTSARQVIPLSKMRQTTTEPEPKKITKRSRSANQPRPAHEAGERLCRHSLLSRARLDGSEQCIASEMTVPGCGGDVGMAKDLADRVNVNARVDHE